MEICGENYVKRRFRSTISMKTASCLISRRPFLRLPLTRTAPIQAYLREGALNILSSYEAKNQRAILLDNHGRVLVEALIVLWTLPPKYSTETMVLGRNNGDHIHNSADIQ